MSNAISLAEHGISAPRIIRNATPALLYEDALRHDGGSAVVSSGALVACSGDKTGRTPKEKRVVDRGASTADVWWGNVNIALPPESFAINRTAATEFLNGHDRVFVVDGYAGWDPAWRLKVRVICARPYHALFMHNMLIRPTEAELADFGEPDFVCFNAGQASADPSTPGVTSTTSVAIDFGANQMVILGTEYAGEMKKGVFTVMNYLMPRRGVLSMHCSANEGGEKDVSLFFGLSGTGKTTLSADPRRALIGDDEHCWTQTGVFNIEGGCYAKTIDLSAEKEPEIFGAIRFGSVLENVVYDECTRVVDFADGSITENTRVSYPIEFIANAKTPCIGGHPKNIVLLTCDAFGVLPPIARLTPAQAMYHFISGYTAKVAGTEVGVTEPEATFSACFGAAFLVLHPSRYAEMLAEKMRAHGSHAWLLNTGWSGGSHGTGKRMKLAYTRAIVDAVHSGELSDAPTVEDPIFGVSVPTKCAGVPDEILIPKSTWTDGALYDETARKLAGLFAKNFEKYAAGSSAEIAAAGPRV